MAQKARENFVSNDKKTGKTQTKGAFNKSQQKKYKIDLTKRSPLIEDIREKLDYYVIGQKQAKDEIVDALARNLYPDPKRKSPISNMMLIGPTGVGKTQIVRALFWILFGDNTLSLGPCKIDANNFTLDHEVTSLIGSPPSYVGSEITPRLADKVIFNAFETAKRNGTLHPILKNYSEFGILLIDEVEKAHPKFHDIFLGIMDEGEIELNLGNDAKKKKSEDQKFDYSKTTSFKNVIIFMTSNLGAEQIQEKLEGKGTVGFKTEEDSVDEILSTDYYKTLVKSTRHFKPEFVARLDSFIPFKPLTKEEYYKRLDLSISIHNDTYSDTGIKLYLSYSAKKYIVEESFKSNQGARNLVKTFDKDIVTIYKRAVFNNSEIDRIEEESEHKVKYIEIDYKDGKYIGVASIDKNHKALKKELKKLKELEERKKSLNDQEVIISLKENSFLYTLKEEILPSLRYYKVLISQKEQLFIPNKEITPELEEIYIQEYKKELERTKAILDVFGFTSNDYQFLDEAMLDEKYDKYSQFFEDMFIELAPVKLWRDDDSKDSFSGMLRYIEKYIRKHFSENKDLKAMVSEGAGKLSEIIIPFMDFAKKLVGRYLTSQEEDIIIRIFHREYVKLNGNTNNSSYKANLPAKVESNPSSTKKPSTTVKSGGVKVENKNIVVNLNFYDSSNITNIKDRMKNLFGDNFELVLLAVRQKLAEKNDSDDIIDIMNAIKIELEKVLSLTINQTLVLTEFVKSLLKEEDLLD